MSHYTGPKNRLSRREGMDLFGKGNKLRRASQPPGQHGPKGARRSSDYAVRLREKQKTKRLYGLTERQFRKSFETATKVSGQTGQVLLQLLESRLDNVVYRLGLVSTRSQARQLIGHGHVMLDNSKVTIPSLLVKPGQVVTLSAKAAIIPTIKARLDNQDIQPPVWLEKTVSSGKVLRLPERADIDTAVDEQLIVEYYSR